MRSSGRRRSGVMWSSSPTPSPFKTPPASLPRRASSWSSRRAATGNSPRWVDSLPEDSSAIHACAPADMERAGRSSTWALFVGPYGLYLLVFLVLPFANVALLSVYLHSPTKIAIAELTGANYAKLWEAYYFTLFLRTLRLAVIVTVVCAVLGFPLAYLLARSTSRVMTLGLFLLIMPLM